MEEREPSVSQGRSIEKNLNRVVERIKRVGQAVVKRLRRREDDYGEIIDFKLDNSPAQIWELQKERQRQGITKSLQKSIDDNELSPELVDSIRKSSRCNIRQVGPHIVVGEMHFKYIIDPIYQERFERALARVNKNSTVVVEFPYRPEVDKNPIISETERYMAQAERVGRERGASIVILDEVRPSDERVWIEALENIGRPTDVAKSLSHKRSVLNWSMERAMGTKDEALSHLFEDRHTSRLTQEEFVSALNFIEYKFSDSISQDEIRTNLVQLITVQWRIDILARDRYYFETVANLIRNKRKIFVVVGDDHRLPIETAMRGNKFQGSSEIDSLVSQMELCWNKIEKPIAS